ncbi:dihydroxyacetone kinase subunit L [Synergistales bacterium]|nr:dihydroxyacetone kinase subunit L [Synergistales bacterium]
MKNALNVNDCKDMIRFVADKIIESKPYLTEVDSAIGDGDHGIGMAGGMQKAKEKIDAMDPTEDAYRVFDTAGKAMLMSMGGASGVIFGSMYIAGAKNSPPKSELDAADIAKMFQKSLAAIKERGHASVGDKTMVDALEPAAIAMSEHSEEGLLEMLKAAEQAAHDGMESTKDMLAKYGRAKSLMERAIGFQDPGATSVWIIIRSMREFVEN